MIKIKFSHRYSKMPLLSETKTHLMEVFCSNANDLHEQFKKWDSHIAGEDPHDLKKSYYKLPCGKVLILLLQTEDDSNIYPSKYIWTTIRPYTSEKEKYYREVRGQQVEIVIEEKCE